MNAFELLTWIENTGPATEIRTSALLFPWIEGVHVIGATLLFGGVFVVDVRLMGLLSRDQAVTRLSEGVLPMVWSAFAVSLLSGFSLFSSSATKYAGNAFFEVKMGLILLAGLNMVAFHLLTYRDVSRWDRVLPPPAAARVAGGVSIALWMAVIALGRYIGFSLN